MTALICSDCNYENEEERIYCHNCGARLDRSSLKKEVPKREAAAETQKRLKRMFDPRRGRLTRAMVAAVKLVAAAACCAALVVMLLPPNLPPEQKNTTLMSTIGMDLMSAVFNRQVTPLVYSEQQVNAYVASVLRRKDNPGKAGFLPVSRMVVQFAEGLCTIQVERHIFAGFAIYSATTYRVRLEQGKIVAEATGGSIGRMPIHPRLLQAGNPLLQRAWSALSHERDTVARLAELQFHSQTVTLVAAH